MAETVAGKKMSAYPNVNDTTKVSAAQKEAFMADAVVVGVGSKPSGQTGKVNYGIPLSEFGGGGIPAIGSNDDGKVLTVDTDHAVWTEPSGGKEYQGLAPISVTGYATGNPTVELNYSTDDFDIDISQSPNRLKLLHPVPSTLAYNDGDVLTITDHVAGDITWATPGGGGGDIVYLDLTVQNINSEWHLTAASLTPQEIISNVQAGKLVIARVIKTYNNVTTNIIEVPFGEYYNGSPYGDGYALWFSPFGSGGGSGEHNVWIGTMRGGLQWDSDLWEHSDIDES